MHIMFSISTALISEKTYYMDNSWYCDGGSLGCQRYSITIYVFSLIKSYSPWYEYLSIILPSVITSQASLYSGPVPPALHRIYSPCLISRAPIQGYLTSSLCKNCSSIRSFCKELYHYKYRVHAVSRKSGSGTIFCTDRN